MNFNNDAIHELVNKEIPATLWHYTSVQGFHGIVESGSIYATDVRFLNDTDEFVHARKVANKLVANAREYGPAFYPLRYNLNWVVDQIFGSDFLNPDSAQIFVASFTASEDDLSQWRGYSHSSTGVSIGFDLRPFRPPVESDTAVLLAPCVYDDQQKENLIQVALNYFVKETEGRWVDVAQALLQQYASSGAKPDLSRIASVTTAVFSDPQYINQLKVGFSEAKKRIVALSGLLKHRAFHHEDEWRLVLPISPGKDKTNLAHPVQYRSHGAASVPYIAFPLGVYDLPPEGTQPSPVLPINDVMLGPGASEEARSAAGDLLQSHAINIEPRMSDVPYRQA